jgi:hypothetical protein
MEKKLVPCLTCGMNIDISDFDGIYFHEERYAHEARWDDGFESN